MRAGDHIGRDALVVEVEERLVVHEDVAAPGAVLQLLDLAEELPVVMEELVVGAPVALDQGVADEQVAARSPGRSGRSRSCAGRRSGRRRA